MSLNVGNNLYNGFSEVALTTSEYLNNWTYDLPMVISLETNNRMHDIQKLLYKVIRYFVEHYNDYRNLMPVSDRINEILSLYRNKPYQVGTYRTDFLVDKYNNLKIIEITCRFALNGFFVSGFTNVIAEKFLENKPYIKRLDEYKAYYNYLMDYFGEFHHICILKGEDNKNETRYTISIFEKSGYIVHVIPSDSITSNLNLLKGAAVICELNHEELCNLPTETLKIIINSTHLNDLRTVFLIHDKRFFSVLSNQNFLEAALSVDEIDELKKYLVPTYMKNECPDIWLSAKENKDKWILKPRVLGKSINVFAGCTTGKDEWQDLFSHQQLKDMVLQSYVEQRKFEGSIGDKTYDDYGVGTLLFFDDNFFGPGIFRTSSYPVTNKLDDRKIASIVTGDTQYLNKNIII